MYFTRVNTFICSKEDHLLNKPTYKHIDKYTSKNESYLL